MSTEPAVLIVADDLSGAADSAAALARRADTAVALHAGAGWPQATVVSVDTDSRYLPGPEAAAVCAAVIGRAGPRTLVYKKIDSTLRGNIGPETAASLASLRGRGLESADGPGAPAGAGDESGDRFLAVVAPAFPATGRTVLDGNVLVEGEPLQARHPARQPLTGQLRAAGLEVALLPLSELRAERPEESLAAMAGRIDAVVVDALTDEDLARTVRACTGLRVLLVGSGGLAHHLPITGTVENTGHEEQLEHPGSESESGGEESADERPTLFCIGSRSAAARAQLRTLLDTSPTVAVPVPLDPQARETAAQRVASALSQGRDVAVFPDPGEAVDPARAGDIAAALATAVGPGLGTAGTLVATGGETARAVLRAAGVHALAVQGEAEAGVVLMRAQGRGRGGGLRVITKAGA
ncbi:MAG TPA: four-carbon acid sugar kinase family protein, partial [Streptomyces sp.]|nr:four-carbon acid sugar kinase family protein [Streptomyces sp.]